MFIVASEFKVEYKLVFFYKTSAIRSSHKPFEKVEISGTRPYKQACKKPVLLKMLQEFEDGKIQSKNLQVITPKSLYKTDFIVHLVFQAF